MAQAETVRYLDIMIDSLEKKQRLYEQLLEKTDSQSICIKEKDYEGANWPQFKVLMVEKDAIIETITGLDEGFEKAFARVKPELDRNKDAYSSQIKKLQENIKKLTDTGVGISAAEERNRQDIERIMTTVRAGIGKARKNIRASNGYIASMYANNSVSGISSIDSKK